jgi:hypothetical protein
MLIFNYSFTQSVKNIYTKYINIYILFIIIIFSREKNVILYCLYNYWQLIKYLAFCTQNRHTNTRSMFFFFTKLFASSKLPFDPTSRTAHIRHPKSRTAHIRHLLKLFQTYFYRKWSSFSYFGRIYALFSFFLSLSYFFYLNSSAGEGRG